MKSNVEDLTGKTSGRLTVISRAPDRFAPNGKKRIYWNCKCSCGNTCEIRSDALRAEKSKSCGCLIAEAAKKPRDRSNYKKRELPSLLGNKYGLLEVVSRAEDSVTPKGRKLPRWNCICECGKDFSVLHDDLRKGHYISCGCVSKRYYEIGCRTANDEFIAKARSVHGDLYSYENSNYIHSQEYLKITCKEHGDFEQWPSNHLQGRGCPSCAIAGRSHNLKSFIEKAVEIYGDCYDYSNTDFVSSKDPVKIVCKIHGEFTKNPSDHLQGQGCQMCGNLRKTVGLTEFIRRSNEIHNFRFDYSRVVYEHSNKEVEIVCHNHGSFLQKASAHLSGAKCPKCAGEDRSAKQHWNYIKRCELNQKLANSSGTLYLLEMSVNDEKFLKVGISSEYKKRLTRYTEFGIDFEILKIVETTALNSAILERDVLKFIKDNELRYIPRHEFKGWTECATLESKDKLLLYYEGLLID